MSGVSKLIGTSQYLWKQPIISLTLGCFLHPTPPLAGEGTLHRLGDPSSWRMRIPEAGLMVASDAHMATPGTSGSLSQQEPPPHQCPLSCLVDAELVIHRGMSALPTRSLQMRASAGNSRGPSKCPAQSCDQGPSAAGLEQRGKRWLIQNHPFLMHPSL